MKIDNVYLKIVLAVMAGLLGYGFGSLAFYAWCHYWLIIAQSVCHG